MERRPEPGCHELSEARAEEGDDVPFDDGAKVPGVQTAEDTITRYLRDAIVRGALEPGEALNQAEIATRFGVSRIPIRNALQRLAAEGLVSIRAHRTATVTELSLEELEEIYAIRGMLEGATAEIAVRAFDAERVDAMRQVLDALEGASDLEAWLELNQRFHACIYEVAERPRTVALIHQLRQLSSPYIKHYIVSGEYRAQAQRGHHRIFRACQRGDPKQARLETERHLADVISGVRKLAKREGGLRPLPMVPVELGDG